MKLGERVCVIGFRGIDALVDFTIVRAGLSK